MATISPIVATGIFSSFCDKQSLTSLFSVIASITGVAYSIFQGSVLGLIGFVLLGVSTFMFRSLNNGEIEKVETEIMQGEVQSEVVMKQENNRLMLEINDLKQNRQLMQTQLATLQSDNVQRHAIQIKIEASEEKLKTEVAGLTQLKTTREQDLAASKIHSEEIQNLLQNSANMASSINTFDQTVDQLGQHKDQLAAEVSAFQEKINLNMTKLSEQLQASSTDLDANDHLENQLKITNEGLLGQQKKLDLTLTLLIKKEAEIKIEEEGLNEKIDQLKTIEQQLTHSTDIKVAQLKSLEEEIEKSQSLMEIYKQKIAKKEEQMRGLAKLST